jgi:hypothetical protein
LIELLTSNWIGFGVAGTIIVFTLLLIISMRPDAATLVVLFLLYANIPVIAKLFYGVPHIVATSFSLLLVFPLGSYLIIRRQKLIIDFPFLLMTGFWGTSILSALLFAKNMDRAVEWLGTYLFEGLALYFLIINVIRKPETLRRVIWALLLTGGLLGTMTLYQEVTHSYHHTFGGLAQRYEYDELDSEKIIIEKEKRKGSRSKDITIHRAGGPIGNPNRYGQMMVVLLPLGLFRFWSENSLRMRLLAVVFTLLILSGVLLSYSRAAFVAILLLLIVMTFMRYIRPSQLMVSAALLVMITLVAAPGYWTRMDTIRGVEGLVSKNASVKPDAITRSRITETLAALYVFFDYPILGVGPAQYSKYYSIEYMGISEIAFRRVTTTRRAHCLYTELAAETGIVGFSLFMAIVFFIMIHLMKARRRWINKNPEFSHMATAILLSIIAYLGTAIFAHLSYQRYYWSLIALGGAAIHIFASEASDDELPDMRS